MDLTILGVFGMQPGSKYYNLPIAHSIKLSIKESILLPQRPKVCFEIVHKPNSAASAPGDSVATHFLIKSSVWVRV